MKDKGEEKEKKVEESVNQNLVAGVNQIISGWDWLYY